MASGRYDSLASPAGAYNWTAQYGGKPVVPDPNASANQSIQGNLSNLGANKNLASQVNTFNEQQLLDQYNMAIPNYSGLVGQQSGIVGSELSGQLPQDVVNQLAQRGAERGLSTGINSPNSNTALMAALGLNTLNLQQQGFSNMNQLVSQAPKAQLFNTESQMTTPSDVQSANWMTNEIAAAPDPQAAAQLAIGLGGGGSSGTTGWGNSKNQFASVSSSPKSAPGSKGVSVPTFASDSMGTIGPVSAQQQPFATSIQDYTNPASWNDWTQYYEGSNTANGGANSGGQSGTGAGGSWYYDSTMGAFVNSLTGEISDSAVFGQSWEGFSWSGANQPAQEEVLADNYDF